MQHRFTANSCLFVFVQEHVISYYYSRALNPAERSYEVYEQECLAVVSFLQHFHVYVLHSCDPNHRPTVFTDHHKALIQLGKLVAPTPRAEQWTHLLLEYCPLIKYRSGMLNTDADALSHAPFVATIACVKSRYELEEMVPELPEQEDKVWPEEFCMAGDDITNRLCILPPPLT